MQYALSMAASILNHQIYNMKPSLNSQYTNVKVYAAFPEIEKYYGSVEGLSLEIEVNVQDDNDWGPFDVRFMEETEGLVLVIGQPEKGGTHLRVHFEGNNDSIMAEKLFTFNVMTSWRLELAF